MNSYTRGDYVLQRFTPDDWRLLKTIRLEALQTMPAVYGSNYVLESGYGDDHWIGRLTNPGATIWGLYLNREVVGVTGIFREADNPDQAKLTMSFIKEAHRGKGLASLFYAARLDRARELGCKRVIITHRKGNAPSEAAMKRAGFKYTHTEDRLWPDGVVDDHLFYAMEL